MKINVLVTGASGQLGKTLNEISSKYSDKIKFTFTSKLELDITNKNHIEAFFNEGNFDYCINCAAYTNVEQAETFPEIAFKVNAKAVKNLTLACKRTNTILIHISTDYVFDGTKREPYSEEDQTNPINEYGKSKLLGEQYITQLLEKYFIIRTSWLYSVNENNFLKTIVDKIKQGEKLQITTSQHGTPTSCKDLSSFIIHLIITRHNQFGTYNFSAQGEATWHDFAIQISKHFPQYDSSLILAKEKYTSNVTRPTYSVLDNSKASKIFYLNNSWRESVDEVLNNLKAMH
jgi:dTDP-4-dehydrorhamnose reductase